MIGRLIIFIVLLPAITMAEVIGTVGQTYKFAERDALTEVVERARKVDWRHILAAAKEQARHFRPELPAIPRATAARVHKVTMTFTLDVDVPDPQNPSRIKYPRGFVFNPLQQFTMPACVIFVNADDRAQQKWLASFQQALNPVTPVLLTDGDIEKAEKALKRPVYYADRQLLEIFGVERVPSVACQNGATLNVEEIDVKSTRH
ncbi:hypothetical protein FO488_00340 [Geobacter sp. FeAm09]|uniref:hypothetical protein n=1 Tax=Geobacter sp. FeAm09 TaxID=2597769 RepID=UPI0011F08297|nr:hypothetical protein [Geobacter sp. FeAm09]QEM66755.1 hypothetical protein FO488_00340 [Geobacter sp. FeAm09]